MENNKNEVGNAVAGNSRKKIDHVIFWPPFLLLLGAVVYSLIDQAGFGTMTITAFMWVTDNFNWLYAVVAVASVIVSLYVLISAKGETVIGGEGAKPKYTYFQWFSMTLCGGIGIGLVFFGVAAPMEFYAAPAEGIEAMSGNAAIWSMANCWYQWTIAPYALYVIFAIPLALAIYNYHKKSTVASALYFAIGDEGVDGKIGKLITIIAVFALIAGVSGGMGQGIMQIGSGFNFLIPSLKPGPVLWMAIAALIIAMFTFSSAVGMDKGLKWVADQNTKLYFAVLIFIIIVGPSAYIAQIATETFGPYVQNFLHMGTYLGVANPGEDWARWWTIFYYAAFICYGPVMAIFLARMAYGRTLKQFVIVNLIAPSMFAIVWFAVFGGTAIHMQDSGKYDICSAIAENGVESAVFEFFRQLPGGMVLIVVFLIVIIISFVTCADAMTTSVAILCTKDYSLEDEGEPPLHIRVLWGVIIGSLAYTMVAFAGFDGTRMLAILCTFPQLFVYLVAIVSTVKGLNGSVHVPRKKRKALEQKAAAEAEMEA